MKLYELVKSYEQASKMVDEDGVISDEGLALIENSELDIKDKAKNIAFLLQNFDNDILILDQEIKRLSEMKRIKNNNKQRLKDYLSMNLKSLNIDKLDTDLFKFSFRKSSSVEITDETIIDNKYYIEKTIKSLDKMAIKEDLKNGDVAGATIKESSNLQIK